MKSKKVTKT